MTSLNIEMKLVEDVVPNKKNVRTHSKRQIELIAKSIKAFRFNCPVLVDSENVLLAGHARLEAAKLLGLDSIPTIRIDHLTEPQIRAFMIAENRLTERGGWDDQLLAIEFKDLFELDLDFDLDVTGFEVPEVDFYMQHPRQPEKQTEQDISKPPNRPPASRTSDLWKLGNHVIVCGNALEENSYKRIMGDSKAAMVFADPPYNVPIDGHVSGNGAVQHREFAMACGEMSSEQFTAFLSKSLGFCAEHSRTDALQYICMDWRHIDELQRAAKACFDQFINLCVWVKTNGGMGGFYRSRHELVFVYRNGRSQHRNNVQLGRHGRNRTNVWEYPGVNTFNRTRMVERVMHPTVKPIELVMDAILDASAPNELVLDPFGGSGTTLLAAERTKRRAGLIEIDPIYVDLTIERWQAETGKAAIHLESGKTYDELGKDRSDAQR